MLRRSARLERNSISYQERWGKGAQAQRWLKKNVIGRSPSKVRSRVSTHKTFLETGGRSAVKASGKGTHFSAQRVSPTALKILKVLPVWTSSPGSGAQGSSARSPRSCTNGNCGLKSTEWNDVAAAVETPAADALSGLAADLPCSKQTGVKDSMMQVSGINSRQVNSATPRSSRNSPANISPCWNPVVLLKKLPELESPVNVMSLGRMDSLEFCLRDSVDAAPSPSPATPQTLGEGVPAVAGCRQAGSCFDCSQFDAHYCGETCISERNENKDAFSISNLTDGLVSAELETAASESVNNGELGNMLEVCTRMAEIHPESRKAATEEARAVAGSRTPHPGGRVPSQYQQAFSGTFAKTANTLLDEDEVARAVRSLDVTQIQRSADSPHAASCFLTAAELPHVDWRWTTEAPTHPRPLPPLVMKLDIKDRIVKQKRGRPRKDATLVTVGCAKRSKSQCCFKQTKKSGRQNPAKGAGKERPQHKKSTTVTDRKMAERGSRQNSVKTVRSRMAQPRKTWAPNRKGTGSEVGQSQVKVAGNKLLNPPKRKMAADRNSTGGQSEEVVMAGNEMSKPRERRTLDRKCAYCAFHTKDKAAKVEHDKVCHPHKCTFCQHRFCSQKVLDAHKAACAVDSFQQCCMCERSILRARRKQHFHSLAHIQHVRVAREVAREIRCHGSIDTYLSSMTCDPMSGCQKCHPAWLSLEQGPWEHGAEEDAAALTEGLKNLPFPMETSAIDSTQSFPQGPVSSSTANATRSTPSVRNILRQTSVLPSAGHQEVLVQQPMNSAYRLQSQTSASSCNVADDPACLQGRGTCDVGPNQANLVSLDPVPLQGHVISTCDLQNQTGTSSQDTVDNSASFLGQIITASDVLNQTGSIMLDTVADLPAPHQGHSVTICKLPNQAAALGDQVTCADPPPQEHTLTSSDLQSNRPRGNANTFIDLLELIDQCDLSAAGLPFDSIDALEIVGMGEEDGGYNFGDDRSKAAAGQKCTLEDLMPLEISKVPDINHTVPDPGTEPGKNTGKELAAALSHPDVSSWSQTSSYSPETCMTTCSASQSLAVLAGQGGAKPLFSMSSQLNTHHCTTDSADFSMAEPFARDGQMVGENGKGAFPAGLPGYRGSVSITLPNNTAQAVWSAQDKIDLENSFDPGSSASSVCEDRDLSKLEENDPRSLGIHPENSVISVSDSASRMPVDLAHCDNTDRLHQNCVATPQDFGSLAFEGYKYSLIHDHTYHVDPSTGQPCSTGGGFGSVDSEVGSRQTRLCPGQRNSKECHSTGGGFGSVDSEVGSHQTRLCPGQRSSKECHSTGGGFGSVDSEVGSCQTRLCSGQHNSKECRSTGGGFGSVDSEVGSHPPRLCSGQHSSKDHLVPPETSDKRPAFKIPSHIPSFCKSQADMTSVSSNASNCLSDVTICLTDTSSSLPDVTVGPSDTSNSLSDVTGGPSDTSNSLSDMTHGPTDTSNSMSDATVGPTDTSNSMSDATVGPTDTSNSLSDVTVCPTDTSNCRLDATICPTDNSNSLSDVTHSLTPTSNSLSDVMHGPTDISNSLSGVSHGPADTSNSLPGVTIGPTDTGSSQSDVISPPDTSNSLSDLSAASAFSNNQSSHTSTPGTSSSLLDVTHGPTPTSKSLSDLSGVSAFSNCWSGGTPAPDTSNHPSDLSEVSAFRNGQSGGTPMPSPFDASRNSPPSTNTSRSASCPSGIKTASATARATADELTVKPASTNSMLAAQEATEDLPTTNHAMWTSTTTTSQETWNQLTMSQRTGNTPLTEDATMKMQCADQKTPNSRKRTVTENISVTRSLTGRTLKSVRGVADGPVVERAGVKSSSAKSAVVHHRHKAVKGGTAENLLTNPQACLHASVKRPAKRTPFGNSASNISLPAQIAEPPEAAGKGEYWVFKKEMDDISVTGLPWAVCSLDTQSSPQNEPVEAVTAPVNQVFVGPQAKSVREVDSSEKQAEVSILAAAHEPVSGLSFIRPAAKNTPAVMTTSTVGSAAVATSTAVTTSTVGATAGAISTVRPAIVTTSTVRPTAVTSSTGRPATVTTSTVWPTAVTSSTGRPATVTTSTVWPTAVTSSTGRPATVATSTVWPTAGTTSTVWPTAVTSSTGRPATVTTSTVWPTAGTTSTVRLTAVTSSTVGPTAGAKSTVGPTAVAKSTVRPTAVISSRFRPAEAAISTVTSTVKATTSTAGSAAVTTSTVRSVTVRTKSNNGTAMSASNAEPSRTKTPTGVQVTESTPPATRAAVSSAATKKVVASNPSPRQSSTVTKSRAKQASLTGTVWSMPASTQGGMNFPDTGEQLAAWRESSIHQQPWNILAAEQGACQDTQQVAENTACVKPFTAVKRSAVARSLHFREKPAIVSALKRATSSLSGPARSSRVVGEAVHDNLKCSVQVPPKGWSESKTAEAHTDASCVYGSIHMCPPLPPTHTACMKPPCCLPTAQASRSEELRAAFITHCSSQTVSARLRSVMATTRAYQQMEDTGMQYHDQTAADGTFAQREEGNLLGINRGGREIFPAGRAVSIHGRIQTVSEHWYNLQMGHRTWRESLLTPGIQDAVAVSCATQRFACSQDTSRALATSNTSDKFGRNGEATVLTPANQQPRVSPGSASQRQANWCSTKQAAKQRQQQVTTNASRYQHCNQSFDSVSRYQHCNQSCDSVVPAVPPKRPKLCRRAAGGYSDVSPRWQWNPVKMEKRYEDFWTPGRPNSPALMSASDHGMLTASCHSPDALCTSSVPHVPQEAHHADSGSNTTSDRQWTFSYQRADSCFRGGRRHSGKLWTWAPSDGLPGK